jgi:hypothetical protein
MAQIRTGWQTTISRGQGTEGGGNEGMGEGRPKTVDVIVMPTVIAVATTHSRKTRPAYEGGGSSLLPLP